MSNVFEKNYGVPNDFTLKDFGGPTATASSIETGTFNQGKDSTKRQLLGDFEIAER
jgi:hypothetical protein